MGRRAKQALFRNQTWGKDWVMRLRQAKKRLWWSKGEGDYISNHRSKNHHENYKKKYLKLRPEYYDEKRGGWVYPSCADIDIVRRANVRLRRWIRKGKKLKEQNNDRQFDN